MGKQRTKRFVRHSKAVEYQPQVQEQEPQAQQNIPEIQEEEKQKLEDQIEPLTKQQKRLSKRSAFLEKLEASKPKQTEIQKKQKRKAKTNTIKQSITLNSFSELLSSLPTEEELEKKPETKPKKLTPQLRAKITETESQQMKAVIKHPSYIQSPLTVLKEHLKNSMAVQASKTTVIKSRNNQKSSKTNKMDI